MHLDQRTTPEAARRHRLTLLPVVAVAAVAAAAILGATLAGAAPSLDERLDSARSNAGDLTDQIASQSAQIASLQQQAREAGAREMVLQAQIETTATRSNELAAQLETVEAELDQVRAEYKQALAVLTQRLIEIYKNDEPDQITVLLNAEGFDDLQSSSEYLDALHDADMRLAEEVEALNEQVTAHFEQIDALKADIDEQAKQLEAAHTEFAAARAEAEQSAAALAQAMAGAKSSLAEVQAQVAKLEEEQMEAAGPAFTGGPYAIPTYIVMCESGGNYHALNPSSGAGGAYQILPSTWRAYGGRGLPHQAPKAEQDRIAAMIWRDSGPAAWACA